MKSKKIKRIAAILVSLSIVLSLSACSYDQYGYIDDYDYDYDEYYDDYNYDDYNYDYNYDDYNYDYNYGGYDSGYSFCNYCNGLGEVSCDVCYGLGYKIINVPNYGGDINHSDSKVDCSYCIDGDMDCPYC